MLQTYFYDAFREQIFSNDIEEIQKFIFVNFVRSYFVNHTFTFKDFPNVRKSADVT